MTILISGFSGTCSLSGKKKIVEKMPIESKMMAILRTVFINYP